MEHYKLAVREYLGEVFSDCGFAGGHLCCTVRLNDHLNVQIRHHVIIQCWGEGLEAFMKVNVAQQRYQTLAGFQQERVMFSKVSLQKYSEKCPQEYVSDL